MTMTELPDDFDERILDAPANAAIRQFFEDHVQELSFCALPADVLAWEFVERSSFTLRVVKQRGYGWSVRDRMDDALSSTGHWRSKYDNRTPRAKSYTSFPLTKAIALAKSEAQKIKGGRYTVQSYVQYVRERLAEDQLDA